MSGSTGPAVCDPFGDNDMDAGHGLKGSLYYVQPNQPQDTSVDISIENGTEATSQLFLSKLDVPTHNFTEGFQLADGGTVKNSQGNTLIQSFALDLEAEMTLGPNDAEGYYELALVSDNGATLMSYQNNSQGEVIVNDDGAHPTRMACSTSAIYLTRGSSVPIRIRYYQGSSQEIALSLIWRKVSGASDSLADPLCGATSDQGFFSAQAIASGLETPYMLQLASRGWSIPQKYNFLMPGGQTNSCAPLPPAHKPSCWWHRQEKASPEGWLMNWTDINDPSGVSGSTGNGNNSP